MDKIKNVIISIVIIVSIVAILSFNLDDREKIEENIRIGVSDDTSGFVINYMKEKEYLSSTEVETLLESYAISDC